MRHGFLLASILDNGYGKGGSQLSIKKGKECVVPKRDTREKEEEASRCKRLFTGFVTSRELLLPSMTKGKKEKRPFEPSH